MGDIMTAIMGTFSGGEFAAFSVNICMSPLRVQGCVRVQSQL